MDEIVSLILAVLALIIGFIVGLTIKINYTYEVYDDVMQTIENVIMKEVENVQKK